MSLASLIRGLAELRPAYLRAARPAPDLAATFEAWLSTDAYPNYGPYTEQWDRELVQW